MSDFDTFIQKPISSKVVLVEFAAGTGQNFFLNAEGGIWKYQFSVSVNTTCNYENYVESDQISYPKNDT